MGQNQCRHHFHRQRYCNECDSCCQRYHRRHYRSCHFGSYHRHHGRYFDLYFCECSLVKPPDFPRIFSYWDLIITATKAIKKISTYVSNHKKSRNKTGNRLNETENLTEIDDTKLKSNIFFIYLCVCESLTVILF